LSVCFALSEVYPYGCSFAAAEGLRLHPTDSKALGRCLSKRSSRRPHGITATWDADLSRLLGIVRCAVAAIRPCPKCKWLSVAFRCPWEPASDLCLVYSNTCKVFVGDAVLQNPHRTLLLYLRNRETPEVRGRGRSNRDGQGSHLQTGGSRGRFAGGEEWRQLLRRRWQDEGQGWKDFEIVEEGQKNVRWRGRLHGVVRGQVWQEVGWRLVDLVKRGSLARASIGSRQHRLRVRCFTRASYRIRVVCTSPISATIFQLASERARQVPFSLSLDPSALINGNCRRSSLCRW